MEIKLELVTNKRLKNMFKGAKYYVKSSFPNPSSNQEDATINKKQTARAAEKSWVSILIHFRQNLACGMTKVA
jgi:hypothetical protein